jgi:hypothetical protein
MPDYLPPSDTNLDAWLDNFIAELKNLQATLGLAPASVNAVEASHNQLKTHLANINTMKAQLASEIEAKNTLIESLIESIRALVRTLQANPLLTDANRAGLGITIPDTTLTPAPVPTTHPIAQIDVSQPLRHTGTVRDESTPNRRAKPKGVHGVEVRYQIGGAEPTDPNQMLTLGTFPNSTFVKDFPLADAGKLVYYYMRWINRRGQAGPWSELVSATITRKG